MDRRVAHVWDAVYRFHKSIPFWGAPCLALFETWGLSQVIPSRCRPADFQAQHFPVIHPAARRAPRKHSCDNCSAGTFLGESTSPRLTGLRCM